MYTNTCYPYYWTIRYAKKKGRSGMVGIGLLTLAAFFLIALGRVRPAAAETTRPVYPAVASEKRVAALKRVVSRVMAMTEAEMVALVPDKTGFRFMGCPNCDEGTQEGQLRWSISDPHRVKCRFCDMVFPNDQYPEDRVMTVVNPVGVEVAYPYWEDATGYRYLFSARGWREARSYFSNIAQRFGELYQATGKVAYARRAALILDAFARYYPGFLVSRDWPHRPKGFATEPPYPNGGGKWGRWRHDEMPTNLVFAYDSIYGSGELERLSEEVGADVKARIENGFFRGAIRQDQFHGIVYGNAGPRIYEGYIAIGRVLTDPGLVHEGVRRSRELFRRMFYEDGFWMEGSVGYHQMTMGGMNRVFRAVRGYSDPPGYVHPEDGTRLDNMDLSRDIPVIASAERILEVCRYPDGRQMTMHDNWAHFRNLKVPEQSVSTLLAGVGHAWLGRGTGDEQAQLHLHFSGGYGHQHADNLNMGLFAKGRELLPDVGYTHTRHRVWSTSTLCHNTVVIDEQRQYSGGRQGPSDGRLLAFEPGFDVVKWVEAGGERAYPGVAQVYRRALLLVNAGESDVYAVDLFRVTGGSQHDWSLHGDADADGDAKVSVPLAPYGEHMLPGVDVRFPTGESDRGDAEGRNIAYAYFQNVSRGTTSGDLKVTFGIDDSPVAVRTHIPGQAGAEVFAGDAMSFRRAEENDALLDRFRMPIFLLRRKGPAPLSSLFVAVHEPYDGEPFVDDVRLEKMDGDAVGISVSHHGVVDHILYRGSSGDSAVSMGDLSLNGDVGFVRMRNGRPEMMGLWGGTMLKWKQIVLEGSGAYEGEVTGTMRRDAGAQYDALVVASELPDGDLLNGATAVVTFGDGSTRGCGVRAVSREANVRHVVLDADPGFDVDSDGMRHLFFPHREIPGTVHYRLRTSAFANTAERSLTSIGEARISGL